MTHVHGTVRPIKAEVLLRRDPAPPELSKGGIYLPETARAFRSTEATVLAVGPQATELKPGDRVLLNEYGGREYRDADHTLLALIDEKEIYAILEPAACS